MPALPLVCAPPPVPSPLLRCVAVSFDEAVPNVEIVTGLCGSEGVGS